MHRPNSTTNGPAALSRADIAALMNRIQFGRVTLEAKNGTILGVNTSRISYTRKPRSRLGSDNRGPADKPKISQAEAIGDLLADVGSLRGHWEVDVKIADSVPLIWDRREKGMPCDLELN